MPTQQFKIIYKHNAYNARDGQPTLARAKEGESGMPFYSAQNAACEIIEQEITRHQYRLKVMKALSPENIK